MMPKVAITWSRWSRFIEMAKDQQFQQQPESQRGEQRQPPARAKKLSNSAVKRHGEIGAEHVLDAVREIDEIHDAEDERQSRRNQKQQDAELQSVQDLDKKSVADIELASSPAKRDEGDATRGTGDGVRALPSLHRTVFGVESP